MVTQSQVSKFSIWLVTICRHRYQCRQQTLRPYIVFHLPPWFGVDSVCLAISGTNTDSLMPSLHLFVTYPLIRTPSLTETTLLCEFTQPWRIINRKLELVVQKAPPVLNSVHYAPFPLYFCHMTEDS